MRMVSNILSEAELGNMSENNLRRIKSVALHLLLHYVIMNDSMPHYRD